MEFTLAHHSEFETTIVRRTIERLHQAGHGEALNYDLLNQEIGTPHAVYDFHADEVAQGLGLKSAHPAGTRYLLGEAESPKAAAEVPGINVRLAVMNFGPFVSGTATGIARLRNVEAPAQGPYELRLLRFAALGLMALWLHAKDHEGEYLFPIEPIPPGLLAQTLYTEQDFLAAVRPAAEKRVSQEKKGRTP